MRKFFKTAFTILFFLAGIFRINAQPYLNVVTTGVPFLRISPDARAGGMADLGIATSPDAHSGFFNTAKFPFHTAEQGLGVNYTPWLQDLELRDLYLASLSYFSKIGSKKDQAISANIRYFSLGQLRFTDFSGNFLGSYRPREFSIDFGYSRKLAADLAIGVTIRYINSSLASGDVQNTGVIYKAGTSVASDISLYHYGEEKNGVGLNWGIVLSNLGSKIGYTSDAKNKDYIPANLGFGVTHSSFVADNCKLTVGLDVNKLLVPAAPQPTGIASTDSILLADYRGTSVIGSWFKSFGDNTNLGSSLELSLGAEFLYNNQFAIRTGYFYQDKRSGRTPYLSMGIGFKYESLGINFSYLIPSGNGITRNPLSNTLRFGFLFDIK